MRLLVTPVKLASDVALPLLLLLSMLAGGCRTSIFEYEDEVRMKVVPAAYREWFSEIVACAGREDLDTSSRFREIEWWTAARIEYREPNHSARLPYATWTEPHRIVIRRDQVASEVVVKHELVHDILGGYGHDSPLFGNCARAAP